jgi:uncharacterized protein
VNTKSGADLSKLFDHVHNVEWVVKISKLCNLRCSYCYEFPFLADRSRMSLAQLQCMFEHIAQYYAGREKRMDFVWHGGEPLLVEPTYYEAILKLQEDVLGLAGISFVNSVQTNLTTLNADVLAFLKSGMLSNIGVSLDLFGDQRVNAAGRSSQPTVLRNMQRLIDDGIAFGCITVLSQATRAHVESVYRFFEEINTSFRLLPIYRTGYAGQQDATALSDEEIVESFKKIVDHWLTSDSNIHVRPIQDYVANAVGHILNTDHRHYYDKWADEVVYIVEPDGSLYSVADPPDVNLCHGNIFDSPIDDMRHSAGYLRAVRAASARISEACGECQYHGICSGFFMGEATPEQRAITDIEGRLRCGVARPVTEYIEQRLRSSGFPWPTAAPS